MKHARRALLQFVQISALLAAVLLAAPAAAQPIIIAVNAGNGITVSPQLYGVNYVWDKIPAPGFANFVSLLSRVTHFTLARYPGGWNAERLDWTHNKETRDAPDQPGIDAPDFISAVPVASFITPSHLAVAGPQHINQVVERSVRLVARYGTQVPVWEIGNEWWLQDGANENPDKYAANLQAYGLLLSQVVPAMKAANPSIKIFATGDWRAPNSFAAMRSAAGSQAWSQIDGISVHIYCGTTDRSTLCSNIGSSLAQIREITGKQDIYVSEWAAPARQNPDDTGIQNAGYTMGLLQDLALANVQMAAYWPPVRNVPAMALLADDYSDGYATGYLFGWMAQDYRGLALPTSGPLPAVAAMNGNTLSVIVAARAAAAPAIRVVFPGLTIHNVVSAQVMYHPAGSDNEGKHVAFAALPVAVQSDAGGRNFIEFGLNPCTTGRGCGYEIARIKLN